MQDDRLDVIHDRRAQRDRRKGADRRVKQEPFDRDDRRIADRRSGQERRSDRSRPSTS